MLGREECRGFWRKQNPKHDTPLKNAVRYANWLLVESRKDLTIEEIKDGRKKIFEDDNFTGVNLSPEYIGNYHVDSRMDVVNCLSIITDVVSDYNNLFDEFCRCNEERKTNSAEAINNASDLKEIKELYADMTERYGRLLSKYERLHKSTKKAKKTKKVNSAKSA